MNDRSKGACTTKCWTAAAIVGAFVFLMLYFGADYSFLAAIILAVITLVLLGFLLDWMGCAETPKAGASASPAKPVPVQAPGPAAKPSGENTSGLVQGGQADHSSAETEKAVDPPVQEPAEAKTSDKAETTDGEHDGEATVEGTNTGEKPATLAAARDGGADDLKLIKGVGPKMQEMLNGMGFFHFDQIAAWTDREVAWVNANLEGFKGRVTRDNWVEQARVLAAGGDTEPSGHAETDDVSSGGDE